VAAEVAGFVGGISGLREFLKEHKGAINYDLQTKRGLTVWDVGRTFGWADFRDFVEWLPPTGESAVWRARKPQSWWVSPEIKFLTTAIHVLELANWQRGGGRKGGGQKPQPIRLPEDREVTVKNPEVLAEKRRAQAEHLQRRREERKKRKRR
jgi:hypothetical protein